MTMPVNIETALKMQGGSKSAIETASQCVRKAGTVALAGVYGDKYNNFPLGNFFQKYLPENGPVSRHQICGLDVGENPKRGN